MAAHVGNGAKPSTKGQPGACLSNESYYTVLTVPCFISQRNVDGYSIKQCMAMGQKMVTTLSLSDLLHSV